MNSLKLCHWNANGLVQHKAELELFLKKYSIDVMLISETHLTQKNYFLIDGYTLYDTKDPRCKPCGGSGILIKKRIKHYRLNDYCKDYLQATNICIQEFAEKITISSIYCPPKHKITDQEFKTFFETLGAKFFAAGDYNAKHPLWGSRLITPRGRALWNTVTKCGYDVTSAGKPTYWPSDIRKTPDLIDFAVMKKVRREQITAESSLELSSDHSPTIVYINEYSNAKDVEDSKTYQTNWLKFKKFLSTHIDLNIPLKTPDHIDLAIQNFEQQIKEAQYVSQKKILPREFKSTSKEIERLLREKRNVRRRWQCTRSPLVKEELNKCTRKLRSLVQAEKLKSLNHFTENLTPNSDTRYSLWRATENLKRPIVLEPPIRRANGTWAQSDDEKGIAFADHLCSTFKPNQLDSASSFTNSLPPQLPAENELQDIHFPRITIKETTNLLKLLKPKKAPGIDSITNKMLIELPNVAVRLLVYIFNAILKCNYFPTSWKMSQILMIPKAGKDPTKVTSYRPISLLSTLSKLLEKLVLNKLTPILEEKKIIPNHQFGFRKKHGTVEQVHRLVHIITQGYENKMYASALFIDVSQAFDKVWTKGLIHKIKMHFPKNISEFLSSYLTNRKFIVKYKNFTSEPKLIEAGVPQGSILGPFLYLLYTADMPTQENTHISTFADDTAIISLHKNPSTASSSLQDHIAKLENWLSIWKIRINEQKCVHITFTLNKESCPLITVNGIHIPQHTHVKYLGFHLDRRLTWKTHIEAKLTQAKLTTTQLYWLIGRNSRLPLEYKYLLYKAVIAPIWSYGMQLWGTAAASTIEKVQRQQSKILRIITKAPWFMRNHLIHRDLNVNLIANEIRKITERYRSKLETHPNQLARDLLINPRHSRLKRQKVLHL